MGKSRPLSREESDSAAKAIEDTVAELISMGFDEQAAREAVEKARRDMYAINSPPFSSGQFPNIRRYSSSLWFG